MADERAPRPTTRSRLRRQSSAPPMPLRPQLGRSATLRLDDRRARSCVNAATLVKPASNRSLCRAPRWRDCLQARRDWKVHPLRDPPRQAARTPRHASRPSGGQAIGVPIVMIPKFPALHERDERRSAYGAGRSIAPHDSFHGKAVAAQRRCLPPAARGMKMTLEGRCSDSGR
jgi:hypothetical protein